MLHFFFTRRLLIWLLLDDTVYAFFLSFSCFTFLLPWSFGANSPFGLFFHFHVALSVLSCSIIFVVSLLFLVHHLPYPSHVPFLWSLFYSWSTSYHILRKYRLIDEQWFQAHGGSKLSLVVKWLQIARESFGHPRLKTRLRALLAKYPKMQVCMRRMCL